MPTAQTFAEAEAHAAAREPLAITPEIQSQTALQGTASATPDVLKDAKTS
jgi:sec-independent protein translocase protein TatB